MHTMRLDVRKQYRPRPRAILQNAWSVYLKAIKMSKTAKDGELFLTEED